MSWGDLYLYIFYERQVEDVNISNLRNEFVVYENTSICADVASVDNIRLTM
jgi:hypothetical protein